MMPIVDPDVRLSRDACPLGAYLAQSSRFHILRMVAVQPPLKLTAAIDGLHYMQEVSTTRGYGGFPNGVVGYCDLADEDALNQLLGNEISVILRGIHFALPRANLGGRSVVGLEQLMTVLDNIDVLSSRALSLDITFTLDQCDVVNRIIEKNPAVTFVMTPLDWALWMDSKRDNLVFDQLSVLAKHENTHIKLCDNTYSKNKIYAESLKRIIDTCANQFGYERIMFASGANIGQGYLSFEEQWRSYVDVTQSYSARHRDQLFRSNAIRVYRL